MGDYREYYDDVRIDKTARMAVLGPNIGNHVSIDAGVYISTKLKIGDYVHIAHYVCVIGGKEAYFEIGDFAGISPGCKIVVISDDFTKGLLSPIVPLKYRNLIGGEIKMERFSTMGVNSVLLPGAHMAEGSALGANSLLTKPTEPWTIYVGSPAKPIGTRNKKWILESARELGYDV